jgi:hypothetical protein
VSMREIGRVVLVQIQQASLKVGEKPHVRYDPAPLLGVDSLLLTPSGVVGLMADGGRLVDVHNALHPATKNQRGLNDISIGFTSHYRAMRDRFGPHMADGCAGENILVEADDSFTLADLAGRLAIQNPATGEIVYLSDLIVAAPCAPFSHFAANQGPQLPAEVLKQTLQFLNDGRRGFYVQLAEGQREGRVQAGDRVFVVDPANH